MADHVNNTRVFIDCDDTLLLFDSEGEANLYGFWKGDPYKVNEELVNVLRQTCKTCFTLIIWSGGGKKYAKAVSDEVFGDLGEIDAWFCKDFTTFDLVRSEDIVIDDQALTVPGVQLRPDDTERLRELLHDHAGMFPIA